MSREAPTTYRRSLKSETFSIPPTVLCVRRDAENTFGSAISGPPRDTCQLACSVHIRDGHQELKPRWLQSDPEEPMRVESPLVQQSLVDSPKPIENTELETNNSSIGESTEEPLSFASSASGSSRTYSVSSLKAAVDYNAKFLTVAGSNLEAADHGSTIPKAVIDYLSGR